MQSFVSKVLFKSCIFSAFILSSSGFANANTVEFSDDFSEFSLDELMNVEVTSVSLTSQSVMESAAAIHVVTSADISRRGVRSLPEALRQVPGLEVSAIGAADYAITSRGFNEAFSNKLLVLIDGRSVYTPLFSGVYWDIQTLPVELIDRIEVIRGPGGSIWGSNAFNGIINVITKSAAETEGLDLRVGGGTLDQGYGYSAFGGVWGEDTHYRLTAKWLTRDAAEQSGNNLEHQQQSVFHTGLRIDHVIDARTKVTVDGNIGVSRNRYINTGPTIADLVFGLPSSTDNSIFEKTNANLRAKWTRALDNRAELTLQVYYDYAELSTQEQRSTTDFSLHHSFFLNDRNHITWGGQFRVVDSNYDSSLGIDFGDDRTDIYASLFFQDQIDIKPNRLKLIAGLKLEHTPFRDVEVQPSVRLAYTPDAHMTLWGAVSRAVRVPSHAENQASLFLDVIPAGAEGNSSSPLPVIITVEGTNDFDSEELVTFEVGIRHQMTDEVFFDVTAHFSKHDNLGITLIGAPRLGTFAGFPVLVQPLQPGNGGTADSLGVEASLTWAPSEKSQLNLMFSYLDINTSTDGVEGSFLPFSGVEDLSPDFQLGVEWRQKIGRALNFNTRIKYVDELAESVAPNRLELDVTLSWKFSDQVTMKLIGENLFYNERQQFRSALSNQFIGGEIPRSLFASIHMSF